MFDAPTELMADNIGPDSEPVREVCILPFPLDEVLLQGETKELCLYEERYVLRLLYDIKIVMTTINVMIRMSTTIEFYFLLTFLSLPLTLYKHKH